MAGRNKRVGDRVTVANKKSVFHGQAGTITAINEDHYEGIYHRPVQVTFDSGSTSWYAKKELR